MAEQELGIYPEKVCYVIVAARELDSGVLDDDDGDSPDVPRDLEDEIEQGGAAEDFAHDATYHELKSFIDGLNREEQASLVALMWLGRSDYALDEWKDAVEEATRAQNRHTADYLLDSPLLADYLEEALSQFDVSCEDFDPGRL